MAGIPRSGGTVYLTTADESGMMVSFIQSNYMGFGSGVMGGDMQPQGHMQTVVRMLDYQPQPQAACDAPRWKVNRDFTLDLENRFDTDVTQQLKDRGYQMKSIYDP